MKNPATGPRAKLLDRLRKQRASGKLASLEIGGRLSCLIGKGVTQDEYNYVMGIEEADTATGEHVDSEES